MPGKFFRVLHVSGAKSWRGGEAQLKLLIDQQLQNGYKVALFTTHKSPFREKEFVRPLPIHFKRKRAGIDPIFAFQMRKLIHQFKPEILHLHDSHAHTAGLLAIMALKIPPKVIVHRRVTFQPGRSLINKWKYRHAAIDKYICISQAVHQVMSQVIPNPSKLKVVYSAVERKPPHQSQMSSTHLRKRLEIASSVPLIAHIAALTKEKGHHLFLDIAKQYHEFYPDEQAKFVIIGQGTMKQELEDKIKEWGLNEVVALAGFIENLRNYLSGIDVLCFPSENEGLGTSVIEAQMAGVPAVCSNVGGLPEVIEHDVNGFLVTEGNVSDYVAYIHRLLHDADLYERMKSQAAAKMLKFEPSKMFTDIDLVYQEVIHSSSSK